MGYIGTYTEVADVVEVIVVFNVVGWWRSGVIVASRGSRTGGLQKKIRKNQVKSLAFGNFRITILLRSYMLLGIGM